MSSFMTVSPESVGIRREGIQKFIEECERDGIELHRLMILRHGKCCAKVLWEPYSEDDMHPLFSFSKSLTATAIGFARQEGLLSLDEKIVDIFPEYVPENASDNLKKCTIHHLLTMSCGQETESADRGPDWLKSFMKHPFIYEPGTFYQYNTVGTNMLAAVIRKKSGQQVTRYLRPRLFDRIGIGEVFCYQLLDDHHIEAGGSGMRLKLEDMAKFTQFMLQNGSWNGEKILNDWYFERAGIKQIETAGDREGHILDWGYGYGYQCWMGPLPHSFRADGAFGQFGLVYPTLDLAVIINGAIELTQTMFNHLNTFLLPAVHEKESTGTGTDYYVEKRSLTPLHGCRNPYGERYFSATKFICEHSENMDSFRHLTGGAGSFEEPTLKGIDQMKFAFDNRKVCWSVWEKGMEKTVIAAMDGTFATGETDGIPYSACARWRNIDKLEIEVRRRDALSGVRIIFALTGDTLSLEADDTLFSEGGPKPAVRKVTDFVVSEK
jgi:hypothetical protein